MNSEPYHRKYNISSQLLLLLTILSLVTTAHNTIFQNPILEVDLDFAQFRYQENEIYLEVYYSFRIDQLAYLRETDQLLGTLGLDIQITAAGNGEQIINRRWQIPSQIDILSNVNTSEKKVGVIGLVLPEDDYIMKVVYSDINNSTQKDSISFNLPYKGFNDGPLRLSDIELCSSLRKIAENTANLFYKNTYEVIPSADRTYGPDLPVLFYYAETYNLLHDGNEDSYYVDTEVHDSEGQLILSIRNTKNKLYESSVEVGTVNAYQLIPGFYTLTLSIGDSTNGTTASSSKAFIVHQPQAASDSEISSPAASLNEAYDRMNEEQLDDEFARMLYLVSKSEIRQYRRLTSSERKRTFLYNLWERLNPGQEQLSEFRAEHLRRVDYADQHFGSGAREGWMTDRGRVIIIYGQPDQIDRFPYEGHQKPYEVWIYHSLQGGVQFIFIDDTGFDDYVLAHSTARNELRDSNWQSRLSPD